VRLNFLIWQKIFFASTQTKILLLHNLLSFPNQSYLDIFTWVFLACFARKFCINMHLHLIKGVQFLLKLFLDRDIFFERKLSCKNLQNNSAKIIDLKATLEIWGVISRKFLNEKSQNINTLILREKFAMSKIN